MPQLPDLSGLARFLELFVAFLGAYLFAVWVSMIIWTVRDIRSRSRDIFAQMLAIVLVFAFNIAGLLLYFILRPRETLAEKNERELAEETMLQDIQERQICPNCRHKVTPEYLVCPNCHTKLRKKCDHCGRVLELRWGVCPFCGEAQGVPAAPRLPIEAPPRPPLPPMRERKYEPTPPRAAEHAPVAVPVPQPVVKSAPVLTLPTIAKEVKVGPPPDGKTQSVNSPAAPPDGKAQPVNLPVAPADVKTQPVNLPTAPPISITPKSPEESP